MKKAFTLIELIVVIIIIGILFLALGYISWSYIHQLNVQNDKETLENAISYVQSSSLSQPSFGKYKNLNFIGIKLEREKKYITYIGSTGDNFNLSDVFTVGLDNFYTTKLGTGFDIYSGENFQENTSGIYLIYKPYNIGSFVVDANGTVFTGKRNIKFYIIDDKLKSYKYCFKFELVSGRLYNIDCN